MSFNNDWNWQLQYIKDVKDILRSQLLKIIDIEITSPEKDMGECTDIIIKSASKNVSVRLRRRNCSFRDLTIRAYNKGYKTEIDKIKEGYGDWYFMVGFPTIKFQNGYL